MKNFLENTVFQQSREEAELINEKREISPDRGLESNVIMTADEWRKEYEILRENPPIEGDYIRTKDGMPILLNIVLREGEEPFIYARVHVPTKTGEALGWYARSTSDLSCYGWKCILLPKSREEVCKMSGLRTNNWACKELRVVRQTNSKSAFLCEVSEW